MSSGSAALRRYAPSAAAALDRVVATTWSTASARGVRDVVGAAAVQAGGLLGTTPLRQPGGIASCGVPTASPVILGFAEQCVLDVSAVTATQRADFLSAAGQSAGDLAAALWVVDVVPRLRAALDALFGEGPWPEVQPAAGDDLWGALDGIIGVVPTLDALDPVTSELVRLRGARAHNCRLCSSLRSRAALRAGAGEDEFAAVDDYRDSDLTPLARAALSFCDAMLWTPGHIGSDVVMGLADQTEPAQRVELVLDVTRNALNKIAVALGADAAHVEDGIEIYDVEPDGTLVYGLDPD